MRKMFLLFASLIAVISANFYPTQVSATGNKDNFFPVAQVVLTPVFLSEDAGFSLLMEGGPRSYRFNGTLGAISCEQHRFKFGGEYLSQNFHYHFNHSHGDFHHHEKKHDWVHQWAVGGKYQYVFTEDCCNWLKYFQVDGYYAKSKNKELKSIHYEVSEHEFVIHRNIVGARSWGLEAGSAIDTCWNNGSLYVAINYDQIKFNKHKHHSEHGSHKDISGVGATIALNQPLWCDLTFGLEYQYKRAYDFIETLLNWTQRMECGDLELGLFYNYVWGKEHINSSNTLGISLGFTFGMDNWSLFGDCCSPYNTDCCVADCSDLAQWIADPAVYMPQVITRSITHREEFDVSGDGASNPNDGAANPNDGAGNDNASNDAPVVDNSPVADASAPAADVNNEPATN